MKMCGGKKGVPSHRWHVLTIDCEDFLKQPKSQSDHVTDIDGKGNPCPWTGHIPASMCCRLESTKNAS